MTDEVKSTLRIVAFKEGDIWVAQCVEHDICVQAKDVAQLRRRMEVALEIECKDSVANGGQPFGDVPPAPDLYGFMFDEATADAAMAGDMDMRIAA